MTEAAETYNEDLPSPNSIRGELKLYKAFWAKSKEKGRPTTQPLRMPSCKLQTSFPT